MLASEHSWEPSKDTCETSEIFWGGVTDGKYPTVGEIKTENFQNCLIALYLKVYFHNKVTRAT